MQLKINDMNNQRRVSRLRKEFTKTEVVEFRGSTLHRTSWGETYRRRKFVIYGVNVESDLVDSNESREKVDSDGGRLRGYSTSY